MIDKTKQNKSNKLGDKLKNGPTTLSKIKHMEKHNKSILINVEARCKEGYPVNLQRKCVVGTFILYLYNQITFSTHFQSP